MGRKKSKRKPPAKKAAQKLADVFDCPFCNHEGSCRVTLNREKKVGSIKCSICDEDYQTPINYLSEPIDVYTEWIDACDDANADAGRDGGAEGGAAAGGYGGNEGYADEGDRTYREGESDDDDDDDGLVDAAF